MAVVGHRAVDHALEDVGRDAELGQSTGQAQPGVELISRIDAAGVAFVGDTLFSLGCGRLFEGTAPMMRQSLEKLAALPGETKIYCGHEYTLSNGKFAVTVDPDNPALQARMAEVAALRAADRFTLPTTIAEERATNPFLRAGEAAVKQAMGLAGADADAVFAEMRARKNRFAA